MAVGEGVAVGVKEGAGVSGTVSALDVEAGGAGVRVGA
jgi:hypothetical protein